MARRRKKSRAAANAKKKDDAHADKSLPALPPNAANTMISTMDSTPADTDTPTELSPRPPASYNKTASSSRSSSQRPEQSPDHGMNEPTPKEQTILPTAVYRKNRQSVISQASDLMNQGDADGFFIPLALDPSAAPSHTNTRSTEPRGDSSYFNAADSSKDRSDTVDMIMREGRTRPEAISKPASRDLSSSPHLGFPEKPRKPSTEETMQIMDSIRKAQGSSSVWSDSSRSVNKNGDDTRIQHVDPKPLSSSGQPRGDRFKLGDVPKSKRSASSRSNSLVELEGDTASLRAPSGSSTPRGSAYPVQDTTPQELPGNTKPIYQTSNRGLDKTMASRPSQDTRAREGVSRSTTESSTSTPGSASHKSFGHKDTSKDNNVDHDTSYFGAETSPSVSSSDTPNATPTINGKPISGPTIVQSLSGMTPPRRAPARPIMPLTSSSESYMTPRHAPPAPGPTSPRKAAAKVAQNSGDPDSPKLPRWSAGGDFTMEEDMARILGDAEENSQSILRRVSNVVRHGRQASEVSSTHTRQHGRSVSETTARTAASPRWPKSPMTEEHHAREISSPISVCSPNTDDPATLRRQLRNSEQRVAELEKQFATDKDLKSLNKKLQERRKTVSVLDSQTEIMLRQLEVLAGYVERAKDSRRPLNVAELEDSAIKDFVQKLDNLKTAMSGAIETLYQERNELLEDKNQVLADRDRALMEFEQLSSKNAQLADMNNDLTHQIQERFKAQSSSNNQSDSAKPQNGLGIYTHHQKDKSNISIHQMDDAASLRPSTSTTVFGSVHSYPQSMDQEAGLEPATVVAAPHVVNIRKGQAKKFWKKGGQTVAKGLKGAFSSSTQERSNFPGQGTDNIGIPYNMTAPIMEQGNPPAQSARPGNLDANKQGGFGLFKKAQMAPKVSGDIARPEHPSRLYGSELADRAEYERRSIPCVVTRCIEEVELRGMDVEGIYRKTGGSGQVKFIQEGFEKAEDFDISDPSIDITSVTSVLKQYFRKLPTPLITFDVYDRVLESSGMIHT